MAGTGGHEHQHEPHHDGLSDDELAARLRRSGYRLTAQRELVLHAVQRLGHATPDELLAEVRSRSSAVNISTIYRNLEVLEELGLVRHAHLSDRAPTYHSVGGHEHFHLVCRNCQRVVSVDADEAAAFAGALERDHGFRPDLGHLTVFGTCTDCAATDEGPHPHPAPDSRETP